MNAVADDFLIRPPADVAGWAGLFDGLDIPVFQATATTLEELRANEDDVDARMIGEALSKDPLMTLKVLRFVSSQRTSRRLTDAETLTAAVVMLGITPFFRAFGPQQTVEERLATCPEALAGLQAVLRRSLRAARFALGFAVHRMDLDVAVIHEAALLHDFAEMLLWVHAPSLALRIADLQRADASMRSVQAQRRVLNVDLSSLQQALMRNWRLPDLLVQISSDQISRSHKVLNVQLAIRLARHSANGWENAAIPDDVDAVATLLNLAAKPTMQLLQDLDERY